MAVAQNKVQTRVFEFCGFVSVQSKDNSLSCKVTETWVYFMEQYANQNADIHEILYALFCTYHAASYIL